MNNRQANRRRGRGGQRQQGGGNPNRDSGNRIDNRARGNAAQLLEKYKNLAADAQRAGDRVNTEYYLQFADHYFRVLGDNRARFEETRRQRDDFDGDDEDFDGDLQYGSEDRGPSNGDQRPQREDRPARDGRGPREDRNSTDERSAGDEGEQRSVREERPAREDRPRRQRTPREAFRGAANDTDEGTSDTAASDEERQQVAPRRRTRVARTEEAPGAEPGEQAMAIDAERLPPALSGEGEGAERPRRRRRVRTDEGEAVPPAA